MRKVKWIIPLFFVMISISAVVAQSCLSVVTDALELAGASCNLTERNQICYGYTNITALPNVNPTTFNFDEQGDIVPFEQIEVMELTPFDEAIGDWGIAIARLQAQLPDTLPGQNVTIVFFGGVSVQNEGISEEGVQAFRFETGIGAEDCLGLPPDGIIIDTPDDASILTFDINGVEVSLGSTAFLRTVESETNPDDIVLEIGMLEGTGFITANNGTVRIVDGEQTTIPLDSSLEPIGAPGPAGDFDMGTLAVMWAFVESLSSDNVQPQPQSVVVTAEPPPVETEIVPCTVSTDRSFHAGLRVGPGLNRTRRAWLDPNKQVTVTGVSDDGEWWQLDKFEAFPSGANSVVELWVYGAEVTTRGNCELVGRADAPPLVAPPVQQPTTNSTNDDSDASVDTSTSNDGVVTPEPIVRYWFENLERARGRLVQCAEIHWYVEYVSAMYLVGAESQPVPLAGISGSYRVCPRVSTTYYLRIVYTDGTQEDFPIFIRRAS